MVLIIVMGVIIFLMGVVCKYLHDDYKLYPNITVGYKMPSAMKDKETWEEANNYFYKVSKIALLFSLVLAGGIYLMDLEFSSGVSFIIQVMIVVVPIVMTEMNTYKFNKNRDVSN